MTCGHRIVKIISLLFTDVTLVLSGSQYNSSCPSYISTRAGKRLCCSTMSRWCSLPRASTSRSSRPCSCCRTRAASSHSCCHSPPFCTPGGGNLIGSFSKIAKTYIVFCHAELCITPFTGLSLFGQVEAAAGRYQAKHQKRSQSRKELHFFRYLVTDYSEPGDEVDKGDCQVWMTSRADVCEGTAAAFPPRR